MQATETVYVVDDDPSTRGLMVAAIKHLPYASEDFDSVESFLDALPAEPLGCLVLDVRLPGMSGLDLQMEILRRSHDLPIIFVSGFADVKMVVQSMRLGAVDFLEKPFRPQHLLDSIYRAMSEARVRRELRQQQASLAARFARLTDRERIVVDLVAGGMTNKAIAAKLSVSPQAIDARRNNAMEKLEVSSIAELIQVHLHFEEFSKRKSPNDSDVGAFLN